MCLAVTYNQLWVPHPRQPKLGPTRVEHLSRQLMWSPMVGPTTVTLADIGRTSGDNLSRLLMWAPLVPR